MSVAVRVDQVSKLYRLGVTRTSVLKSVSNGMHKVLGRSAPNSSERRELWALRDVSFELSKGQSMALVGRNGAGKSTLLKLLANITRPTSGSLSIEGRLSALIELGSGFHPDLTGRENIFLNGTILGLTRNEIQQRFDEIVEFSELERFIETPIKRYSSGMLVRLGFAVASCIEPDILLVDEVLAVGDASFRQKCVTRIHSLLENGTSIIFVSHNLYMVQAVCSQSIYLERGIAKFHGKTSDVIDMYEHDLHEERAQKIESGETGREKVMTDVEVVKINTLDEDGQIRDKFRSDQSLEIRVHYNAFGTEGPANAVIRVLRIDGTICCMRRTMLDDVELLLHKGNGTFSVVLQPIQLTGGMYYVDMEITTEQDNIILATAVSDRFYVEGLGLSHDGLAGIFEPNGHWVMSSQAGDGRVIDGEKALISANPHS